MEHLSDQPSVADFDTLLEEMRTMDDRSKPILKLLMGEGPSESALTEMVDHSRELTSSAEHMSDTVILQQIARVRVLANTLHIRALFLGMFRDDNDRGRNDNDRFPTSPKHPRGSSRSPVPVLAA